MEEEQFDEKREKKLLNTLKKVFMEKEQQTEPKENQRIVCIDKDTVFLVEAISSSAKKVLNKFEQFTGTLPDLNQASEGSSKVSTQYLKKAVAIFEATDKSGSMKLTVKRDYPIVIEDDNFKIVIAPRIE